MTHHMHRVEGISDAEVEAIINPSAADFLGMLSTALLDAELNLRRAIEDSPNWDWKPAARACANRMQSLVASIMSRRTSPLPVQGTDQ